MKMIGKYVNGDYTVILLEDGTKIRINEKDSFNPIFPESIDLKITNRCDRECSWCHEGSKPDGKHGDIMNAKFIESLNPYTELAIGGGNPLEHPDILPFLKKCKSLRLIPSMTVNQTHFINNYEYLKELTDKKLIYGLGVSLQVFTEEFMDKIISIPNAIIHVIAGINNQKQMTCMNGLGLKILILGYKSFRKGIEYFNSNKAEIEANIKEMAEHLHNYFEHFDVVSFDNLAIEQLNVRDKLSESEFDEIYMGDDGQFTMYVDLVEGRFAKSSTSTESWRIEEHKSIEEMFDVVKKHEADPLNGIPFMTIGNGEKAPDKLKEMLEKINQHNERVKGGRQLE